MINQKYLNMLKEEIKKSTIIPPEGKTPQDGLVIQRPNLIHYAPNNCLDKIRQNGLHSEEVLCANNEEMKEKLVNRYSPFISNKLNIPEEKITPNTILHFLNMYHPGHTRCIYSFFSRIPEGIKGYNDYLSDHTPIRISLAKLKASDASYNIYGVNFPGVRRWVKLKLKHIIRLCNKNNDWYNFFAAVDPQGFFNKVPHGAIYSPTGVIPSFCLKVLTDKDFVR